MSDDAVSARATHGGHAQDRTADDRARVTRARLAEAATAAFAEKGFNGTTTRDIASAAGMSPAALYVHHSSKEELLYQISRAGHEETLRTVRAAAASEDDPAEVLCAVMHDFALQHARTRTRARIVNYELAALTPEHFAEIRELRRTIEHEFRTIVERGVASGDFDVPDPEFAAVALLSLGIDIARWFRSHGRWSPEHVAQSYAAMALRIVGADPHSGNAHSVGESPGG
ncbi:TetR/AcrR family transcriptional regulator [Tomitella fengzijianii]|uniref:TetR/AcrR family transcriptional regulator n=1 Tax=Tomitella fengzijianii TaxID=2597660 RepID=A0A516X6P4_9ACTN|nr:TetR/AcrR family transcriptional regulator [Tomitella fengzijianii]QDQ98739.1 TetR/AcrR family transcriptional regulator [Tomitella fengzijianii]